LDNSAEDETGSYDGTESNIEYRFGRFGQAAVFNGSSSYIDINNITGISGTSSQVSISAWFNFSGTSGDRFIISLRDGCLSEIGFNSGYSPRKLEFKIFDGGNKTVLVDESSITYNNWHHIVLTAESGGLLTAYLDGVSQGTTSIGTISNTTQNNSIGAYNISGTPFGYFDGSIDQVRIYSTALTSSQVTELYEEKPCADTSNFKAVLYEGNGGTQYISNVGFDLDVDNGGDGGLVWIKKRSGGNTRDHMLYDSVRGAGNRLRANQTYAESYATDELTSFDSNGFFLGSSDSVNGSSSSPSYVSWVWKGGGDAVNIGVNSITASTPSIASDVSANTEGFSIVKYTGNGTAGATVAHGLDNPPDLIIVKSLDASKDWYVFSELLGQSGGEYQFLELNDSPAANTFNTQQVWNGVLPTSDVFTLTGGSADNTINDDYIAYCWHSVAEYSKIGTYTGNGSTTGTIVSLDFAPSFVVIKGTDQTSDWIMIDNKRDTTNPNSARIDANSSGAEYTGENIMDLNTDGFQLKTSSSSKNGLDKVFIYMAFK
jgi:hypothetical protein